MIKEIWPAMAASQASALFDTCQFQVQSVDIKARLAAPAAAWPRLPGKVANSVATLVIHSGDHVRAVAVLEAGRERFLHRVEWRLQPGSACMLAGEPIRTESSFREGTPYKSDHQGSDWTLGASLAAQGRLSSVSKLIDASLKYGSDLRVGLPEASFLRDNRRVSTLHAEFWRAERGAL